EHLQALARHGLKALQHLDARPGAVPVHPDLIALAKLVFHMLRVRRRVVGGGEPEQARLTADQVSYLILHGPARAIRWGLPPPLCEGRTQRRDGTPDAFHIRYNFLVAHDFLPATAWAEGRQFNGAPSLCALCL